MFVSWALCWAIFSHLLFFMDTRECSKILQVTHSKVDCCGRFNFHAGYFNKLNLCIRNLQIFYRPLKTFKLNEHKYLNVLWKKKLLCSWIFMVLNPKLNYNRNVIDLYVKTSSTTSHQATKFDFNHKIKMHCYFTFHKFPIQFILNLHQDNTLHSNTRKWQKFDFQLQISI